MTNEELRRMRKAKHLTQHDLASAIGYSRKSVISWENSVHPIPEAAAAKILVLCVGPDPAPKANTQLTHDTVKYYREMRQDFSHADIIDLWVRKGFTPSAEAQAAILAEFPDIKRGAA